MRFQPLWPVLLCLAILAGSFTAGLALLGSPSSAPRQTAGLQPRLSQEKRAPKDASEAKAVPAAEPIVNLEGDQDALDFSRPAPRRSQVTWAGAAQLNKCVGQRVTWVGQPIHSQCERDTTQHILFGQGPDDEFSFDYVFVAEEPGLSEECPGYRLIHELKSQWLKEDAQRRRDEVHRRIEERRQHGPHGYAETKRFLDERRQYNKEHPAQLHGPQEVLIPVYVTVTGTINRLETLIFLGHGQRYVVPVLRDVTITANP